MIEGRLIDDMKVIDELRRVCEGQVKDGWALKEQKDDRGWQL